MDADSDLFFYLGSASGSRGKNLSVLLTKLTKCTDDTHIAVILLIGTHLRSSFKEQYKDFRKDSDKGPDPGTCEADPE